MNREQKINQCARQMIAAACDFCDALDKPRPGNLQEEICRLVKEGADRTITAADFESSLCTMLDISTDDFRANMTRTAIQSIFDSVNLPDEVA